MSKQALYQKFYLLLLLFTLGVLFNSCRDNFSKTYSYDKNGEYYYHLISYETDVTGLKHQKLFKICMSFQNQSDSIFWDTYNNYKNSFVIKMDSSNQANVLSRALYRFNTNDSGVILIRSKQFFKQQFNVNEFPFFAKTDTLVKINFKINEEISQQEFLNMQQELLRKEVTQIRSFLGSKYDLEKLQDTLGFYWIEKPDISDTATVKPGDFVTINYEAFFCSGRFLEKSPAKFEFIYGTPDQILKGLNYVIPKLKIGQNAKIVLPSRLAFGETGSANGTVPPFTPLVYKLKLIDIKKR